MQTQDATSKKMKKVPKQPNKLQSKLQRLLSVLKMMKSAWKNRNLNKLKLILKLSRSDKRKLNSLQNLKKTKTPKKQDLKPKKRRLKLLASKPLNVDISKDNL